MDAESIKQIFLDNLETLLKQKKLTKTWLNSKVFGTSPKGKPKNNFWRIDQKRFSFDDILKAAEVLNVSVERLVTSPFHTPGDQEKGYTAGEGVGGQGLFGETRYMETERGRIAVTILDGDRDLKLHVQDDAMEMLAGILSSGDRVITRAILSNLHAFSRMVKKEKEQSERIAELERRLDELEKKVK